jgi:thiosulfate dehydrogenase [quinone] large subunit
MSTTNVAQDLFSSPAAKDGAAVSPPLPVSTHPLAARSLALLRIATGFVFLWAFLDKLIGLGYSTTGAKSWLSGGSPTTGFLGHADLGPFQSFFRGLAGSTLVDVAFMACMLGVGVAVIAGVGLRLSAIAGGAMMLMMWAAEWPLARFTSEGAPAGSSNPLIDYHIIYALALVVVAATAAGSTWGLGARWASLPVVRRFSWLR